jgi:endonuclease-3
MATIGLRLKKAYPGTAKSLCALSHKNAYELLVATILSAQCTDERVNGVLAALFARFPSPAELAFAKPDELEGLIRSTGFFRSKSRNLTGMAHGLMERFGGVVPRTREELVSLPGVGRKTANVVLSVAYGAPGLPVDTHVLRLAKLLGLTKATEPEKVEADLCGVVPEKDWGVLSIRLILHGRSVCVARRPRCDACILADLCPSAQVLPDRRKAPSQKAAPRASS